MKVLSAISTRTIKFQYLRDEGFLPLIHREEKGVDRPGQYPQRLAAGQPRRHANLLVDLPNLGSPRFMFGKEFNL